MYLYVYVCACVCICRYVKEDHLLAKLYMFAIIARGSCFGKANPRKARAFARTALAHNMSVLESIGDGNDKSQKDQDVDVSRFGPSIHFIRGVYFDDVIEDHDLSFREYQKAALGGHVSGMVSLGFAYAMGQGSPLVENKGNKDKKGNKDEEVVEEEEIEEDGSSSNGASSSRVDERAAVRWYLAAAGKGRYRVRASRSLMGTCGYALYGYALYGYALYGYAL